MSATIRSRIETARFAKTQPGTGRISEADSPTCSGTSVRLGAVLKQRLEDLTRAGYPYETCGLLIGRGTERGVEVLDLVQARNLNRERAADRFELDPDDFMTADRQARERQLQIVGIWHSHPDHPAEPSATDLARAWPDWSYVIVSISRRGAEGLRSWRLKGGVFAEEELLP